MTVRVGKMRFDDWVSLRLPGGWSDTFVFHMPPTDGLPPGDYAGVIRALALPLRKQRKSASLWLQVEGQGRWFAQEVRYALRDIPVPVAVTAEGVEPEIWDFSYSPRLGHRPFPQPPSADPYLEGKHLRASALSCLRVLARSDCARTIEVASLANYSHPTAWRALHALREDGYVRLVEKTKFPLWRIRRPGVSLALRSWGVPPGRYFRHRRERGRHACKERLAPKLKKRRPSAGRHRRTARLWPAWLRKAWPQAQVWAGWTEVYCGRRRPDALCWGQLDGCETLFWLEVEGGNSSDKLLREKTLARINFALVYARGFSLRLVFVLLGTPRVQREGVKAFRDLPDDVAVVVEDWKAFQALPVPIWGSVRWR